MNYNEKILELIKSLINLTDKKTIQWMPIPDYMDISKNRSLKRYLIENNSYIYSFEGIPIIEEYSSYTGAVNGGQVFLFTFVKENKSILNNGPFKGSKEYHYVCAIQANTLNEIVVLSNESNFQDELKVLKDRIEATTIEADYFLESIINLSDEN